MVVAGRTTFGSGDGAEGRLPLASASRYSAVEGLAPFVVPNGAVRA